VSAATLTKLIEDYDLSHGRSGFEAPSLQAVSESNEERRALVIGDLHGHLDRFEALLKQEGLLDRCDHCEGTGDIYENCGSYQCEYECKHSPFDCLNCDGEGWARTREPVDVILVGDVGHFGDGGSPTGDLLTWKAALRWADVILWGNHDRAYVEAWHQFRGYYWPGPEIGHVIGEARAYEKVKLAHASHGFLITHAGLHAAFGKQSVDDEIKKDPYKFANWINEIEDPNAAGTKEQIAVRDAISLRRGGRSNAGGILWRDIEEKLYTGFRQVFGHSADHIERKVRFCWSNGNTRNLWSIPRAQIDKLSYCVDVGGKGNLPSDHCLAGVYLPDETVVRVDL
jgi:hypothetical protein